MRGKAKAGPGQLPLFVPDSAWEPPDLSSLPSWKGARRVSVDVETRDEQLRELGPGVRRPGCYIVGYSFAIEDGPSAYIPIRHGAGGNVDAAQGLAYLRHEAASFDGDVVGAHLDYDLDFLAEERVTFPSARSYRDVQVAAALLYEMHDNYSLEAIARRAGIPGKDETLLKEALAAFGYSGANAKRGLWQLHSKYVGPYGVQDVRLPLQLLTRQERELEEQDLWNVWNLESEVLPILTDMRRRGVRVSVDRLDQIESWSRAQQQLALDEVKALTGVTVLADEVMLADVLARVLAVIGVTPGRTRQGKISVDKALLESIQHPVGKLIRRARQMSQLRSTFCNSVRSHLVKGRIHCTFNQLRRTADDDESEPDARGAAYGRLSSENPNMQQQPARDPEIGPLWRSIYLPDEGGLFAVHDYSQQEPRVAVHYGVISGERIIGRAAYLSALKAQERFVNDPSTDFHRMMTLLVHGDDAPDRVGPKQFKLFRDYCKQIYLGLSYGMGGAKMCRKLGLPTRWALRDRGGLMTYYETRDLALHARSLTEEGSVFETAGDAGQAIIDKFDAQVPFVRATARAAEKRAKQNGFVVTIAGRRCRFPEAASGGYDWTHKAFNRVVQGTSADQTKTALVSVHRAGFRTQLQVHDELDLTVSSPEESRRYAEIMENCFPLKVPSRAEAKLGPSWGEAA